MELEKSVTNLFEGNQHSRVNAANEIISHDPRFAVYSLKNAFTLANEEKRAKAINSLIQVGVDAIPLLIELFKCQVPVSKYASDALVHIGSPAVEAVIACLSDEAWETREAAAQTLGNLNDARAIRPLSEVLQRRRYSGTAGKLFGDWDANVCIAVIEALAKLADDEALVAIERITDDPSEWVRQSAAQALSEWGKTKGSVVTRTSMDTWIKMLDDSSEKIRLSAVQNLTKMKDPKAISALIRALKDSVVCGEIIDSLDKMKFDDSSVGILLSGIEEGNLASERYVLRKLKQIGPAARNNLVKSLDLQDPSQRLVAARALAALKDVRAVEVLLSMVDPRGSDINSSISVALAEVGAAAVEPLLRRLRPQDDFVSTTAFLSLINMGTAAIPVFIQTMDSRQAEPYARYECAGMITSICKKNNEELRDKWKFCVCSEHLTRFQKRNLPLQTNVRRIMELRKRDHYLRQSALLSKLADAGVLTSGFSELLDTVSTGEYYACSTCNQDRSYFSPVKQIVLVLDDSAPNAEPKVENGVLYYPWSPLMTGFRFDRVEIQSIVYPYSTTIERFVHRFELEKRPLQSPDAPASSKISCNVSASCTLSAADQNRLQTYVNLY